MFSMRSSIIHKYCFLLLVLCVALLGFSDPISGDEGSDFLDNKELDVEKIVKQSIIIAGQQCELLATCDNPTNCSHDACSLEDMGGLECMPVANNKFCSLHGATNVSTPCNDMRLDYGRSFVRKAASTNLNSVDTMLAICSTRGLEPLFKTLSNASVLSRTYFASLDGSYRIYPGTAQDAEDCQKYDPRIRPWYRTATSVVKIVVVLIDLGASMGNNLPPDLGVGTILQAAKNMVKQLLYTLSAQDYINIILYDSSRVIELSPSAVLVQEHNSTETTELDQLRSELDKYRLESQTRQSNISAAILAALPNFDSNPHAAKVIVTITDGVFATLGANVKLPTAELLNLKVKVFVFKLRQPSDTNVFMKNNTIIQQLCDVGGHFEPILKSLDNPLLAFRSYLSYLANLKRMLTNGRPQYSQVYQDFEATFGGNIISVSKPVFLEGNLIGVAGITIYIEALGKITDQVKLALRNRTTAYGLAALDVVLNAANCSLVSETLQPCGSSTAYFAQNGGLCKRADPPKSTIQELMCCGTCSAPPSDGTRRVPKLIVIIVSVLGVVLVLVVLLLGIVFYRRGWVCCPSKVPDVFTFKGDSNHNIPEFKGPDHDLTAVEK